MLPLALGIEHDDVGLVSYHDQLGFLPRPRAVLSAASSSWLNQFQVRTPSLTSNLKSHANRAEREARDVRVEYDGRECSASRWHYTRMKWRENEH